MKSKVLQNKEEKRQKLLASAFYLMTNKDIHDISISELASQAGIAKGTFYLYFQDKYELRDFLISMESEKIMIHAEKELEKNDIRGFEDAIVFFINQVLAQLESNPLILNFIRHNLSWGVFHSQLTSRYRDDSFNLISKFEQLAKRDNYHFENPEIVLFMILELTSSVCYNSLLNRLDIPFEKVRPCLFDSIRAILHTGKQSD